MAVGEIEVHRYKMILVGDMSVGKTSLLNRVHHDTFTPGEMSTIGVDYSNYATTVEHKGESKKVVLQVWDTSGQERFASLTSCYYRDAEAAMVVYDIARAKTFENAAVWLGRVREHARFDPVIMLVGNKADLVDDREVRYAEALEYARNEGLMFCEVSAKIGQSTDECFTSMAHKAHAVHRKRERARRPPPERLCEPILVNDPPDDGDGAERERCDC